MPSILTAILMLSAVFADRFMHIREKGVGPYWWRCLPGLTAAQRGPGRENSAVRPRRSNSALCRLPYS
jgi:hypothetical protein